MKIVSLFLAIIFVGALVGCETTHEERTALTGGLIGAAAGGIIGHQSGKAAEGAAIGAAIGGIGGYLYGRSKTRRTAEGNIERYVECPKCGTTLTLPGSATAGNKIKCGSCGTTFILR